MTNIRRICLVLAVAVLPGCPHAPHAATCTIGSPRTSCIDYNPMPDDVARLSCATAGGVFATWPMCGGGVASCRQTDMSDPPLVLLTRYYAPFTRETARMECPPSTPAAGWSYVFFE